MHRKSTRQSLETQALVSEEGRTAFVLDRAPVYWLWRNGTAPTMKTTMAVSEQDRRNVSHPPGRPTIRGGQDTLAGGPGKQTLVQLLGQPALAPQAGEVSTASRDAMPDAHAAAAHGVGGPAQPLPFAGTIQRLFGRHDVSDVQAHTDAAAAAGARGMEAKAFATGNHVAFASAPDLRTAAHEAAHVVQQRGGVQLKGGVGELGDSHERHADQVADRVVAGEAAEDHLDHYAPGVASVGLAANAPNGEVHRQNRDQPRGAVERHREAVTDLRAAAPAPGPASTSAALGTTVQRAPAATDATGASKACVAASPSGMWERTFGEASIPVGKLGRVQAQKGVYLRSQPLPGGREPRCASTLQRDGLR